jgi:hypothetical protein
MKFNSPSCSISAGELVEEAWNCSYPCVYRALEEVKVKGRREFLTPLPEI